MCPSGDGGTYDCKLGVFSLAQGYGLLFKINSSIPAITVESTG